MCVLFKDIKYMLLILQHYHLHLNEARLIWVFSLKAHHSLPTSWKLDSTSAPPLGAILTVKSPTGRKKKAQKCTHTHKSGNEYCTIVAKITLVYGMSWRQRVACCDLSWEHAQLQLLDDTNYCLPERICKTLCQFGSYKEMLASM